MKAPKISPLTKIARTSPVLMRSISSAEVIRLKTSTKRPKSKPVPSQNIHLSVRFHVDASGNVTDTSFDRSIAPTKNPMVPRDSISTTSTMPIMAKPCEKSKNDKTARSKHADKNSNPNNMDQITSVLRGPMYSCICVTIEMPIPIILISILRSQIRTAILGL